MTQVLELAARLAADYLDSLDTDRISPKIGPDELRARLARELPQQGVAADRVIRDLNEDAAPGLLNSSAGRFFGWVIGGATPASIAADWLTSAWDQNAAAHACSPAAAIVEEVVGDWLKDLLGMPSQASYAFVTGCQMAHVTALAAARHQLLSDRGWVVEKQGLAGSPPIRVLVGEHHETLLRALRLLGIGTNAVVQVAMTDDGTVDPDALETALQSAPEQPTIVSLAAGDLNRGAFDPFEVICDMAHRHGAWVHVDGAFGLWVAASPRLRHLVRGVAGADSWATDAHKWLNVPYDSGIAFVAHPEAHRLAMTIPVAYKVEVGGARDQIDWNPEWSRRARAIPLYAALRNLGRQGVADVVERCCDLAAELVERLAELPDVEIVSRPIINQGLLRFRDAGGDHDARTEQVISRIVDGGEVWFGPTTWNGMRVMRISVSSYRTSKADIERAVAAVAAALS
jgi:glutamate/tyrosine decarboxylase-like PLP-dependent enzyme